MRPGLKFGILMACILCSACSSPQAASGAASVDGKRALEHVSAQLALGPRPSGSPELQKCREYIRGQLTAFGYEVEDDAFTGQTPYGPIPMHNLIARKGGVSGKPVVVLASHYETKLMEGTRFVGANDPGSSAGLLLELARVLAENDGPFDYWFLFTDGEEAFVEWSTFDSTYGSRHLAQRWKQEGVTGKIRALILLDLIGDKDLDILYETNSTPWLMDLVWGTARQLGLGSVLSRSKGPVEDDHLPFLDVGIPCVDIIDLNYGPGNSYFHSAEDTLDKISPDSMEKVGRIVLGVLSALQKQNSSR